MGVSNWYDKKSEALKRKRRREYLRLRRAIRYKIFSAIGCILLMAFVVYLTIIWFVEREKSRQLGLTEQEFGYHLVSREMGGFFEEDAQIGVSRSAREDMQNMTGSGMNVTDSPIQPTEDPRLRRQFPQDIFTIEQKRMGAIILHILGIIYMFSGLALVCDEFFVPSLEIIIMKFNIPEDVAGATFMAAGGSAPEFFTSLVGVFFARNAIGFGTIVGSAVFNILFVIGVVGLLSKGVLLLTWWPTFRDTIFYLIHLGFLIGFFQDGLMNWYESLALFILYILYVLFMFVNSRAERLARKCVNYVKDKICCCTCSFKSSRVQSAPDPEGDGNERCTKSRCNNSIQGPTILVRPREPSNVSIEREMLPGTVPSNSSQWRDSNPFRRSIEHHTLRVSSAKNSETIDSEASTGHLYPVITESTPSPGMEPKSFKLPPLTKPQLLTKSSTRTLLDLPRRSSNDSGFRTNSSCTGSEIDSLISHEVISRINSDRSLVITNSQAMFVAPDPSNVEEEIKSVISLEEKPEEGKNPYIRRRSFNGTPSNGNEREANNEECPSPPDNPEHLKEEEEEDEEEEDEDEEDEGIVNIIPPKGWKKRIAWAIFLPLIVLLFFTLPDVKKPRWRCFWPWVFVGSVLWIGVFSYFMVWWATEFGDTANIPPSVMGLTFLAAGTSIPDLITSVIVARKGYGDMALSSSIGSNIFDVTVGLPIPWLLFSAINGGAPVTVASNGLFCSVLLLVGMLLVMIISITLFRWRLGKLLGAVYMVMYFIFLTFSILLELVINCTIGGSTMIAS